LLAVSAKKKGDNAAAREFAGEAFTRAPGTATLLFLASYKEAAGDHGGALQLYRTWVADNPEDVAVTMALANSLQMSQNVDEAMQYYHKILQLDPDNAVALNNIAWQMREDDPVKALEYARHAVSVAPDSPAVLDTLAVIEFINKDYKQAQRSVERALRHSPDNPSMLYHSAMISAAIGDKASAIELLESLIAGGAAFPEQVQANELLATLRL
jgi:Flp pilus assembly protein TadD